MEKLTKREKVIMACAGIAMGVMWFKLKDDLFKAGAAYNAITNKLCSGGVWMATDITSKGFNLIRLTIK
jgi:hypothetical protein